MADQFVAVSGVCREEGLDAMNQKVVTHPVRSSLWATIWNQQLTEFGQRPPPAEVTAEREDHLSGLATIRQLGFFRLADPLQVSRGDAVSRQPASESALQELVGISERTLLLTASPPGVLGAFFIRPYFESL